METTGIETWNRHYLKPESKQRYPDEALVRMLYSLDGHIEKDREYTSPWALDFGCGSGRHIALLQDRGLNVVGCDSSENAINHCRQTHPEAEFHIVFDGSIPPSPAPDKKYSIIVCWGVLHYLEEAQAQQLLKNFRDHLRPGGHLVGTLRKDSDTHFAQSAVSDSKIQLASERRLKELLGACFSVLEYGYMERSILGHMDQIVAHWFFRAYNP